MVIKGVLREELQNSIQMKANYEKELSKLPKGSLIKKHIKGHEYFYILSRERGKVKFKYRGKNVSEDILNEYKKAKILRAKYRNLLSQVKKQIRFLKGTLRGKAAI